MSQPVETPPVEEGRESWQEGRVPRYDPTYVGDYMPFGNVETRNGLQALVEIPLMLRALRLPRRARVLEIGCGRGVALPFEAARFDLVIDFGTCYHVSDTMDGRRAALREVARVLRTGGLFVHETCMAQRLAHPLRSFGRALPWWAVPTLVPDRSAVLWGVRRKIERS